MGILRQKHFEVCNIKRLHNMTRLVHFQYFFIMNSIVQINLLMTAFVTVI
jgi:hypothetical protein